MKLFRIVAALFISVAMFNQCDFYYKPDLEFNTINYLDQGTTRSVETGNGQKTVIHFYASWCGDCRREMPDANKVLSEAPGDIRIYYLTDDNPQRMANMTKKYNIPFTPYQLENGLKDIGVNAIPLTYFIGEDGKIEFAESEHTDWNSDKIKTFLGYN